MIFVFGRCDPIFPAMVYWPFYCPFFWVNCCSIVCRKCTVEKLSIMVGFKTLFPAHNIPLALVFGTFESVQCLADMTRDQPQRGSTHIPTVAFHHFDSVHFTPCVTQSFSFSFFILIFLVISRSAGMETINGLALLVTERKDWRERG